MTARLGDLTEAHARHGPGIDVPSWLDMHHGLIVLIRDVFPWPAARVGRRDPLTGVVR